jgi:hypothetical protein
MVQPKIFEEDREVFMERYNIWSFWIDNSIIVYLK